MAEQQEKLLNVAFLYVDVCLGLLKKMSVYVGAKWQAISGCIHSYIKGDRNATMEMAKAK